MTSAKLRRTRTLLACLALVGLALAGAAAYAGATRIPLSAFPRERIAVETRSAHRHLFEAWRAETYATRAQGFMYVTDSEVRPDQAMIFIYDPPERVSMWMKNTVLSLDMLFVDRRGCIVTLHERARPGSLETIHSGAPITLVVELKAGTIKERGIRTGDRVLRLDAGWPRVQDAPCATTTSPVDTPR